MPLESSDPVEKVEDSADEAAHPNAHNRKRSITKYDQDLIGNCTFTETRCRPLNGKRKIEFETPYDSAKTPRKTVHIIRGNPKSIARRLKTNALKKLTFSALEKKFAENSNYGSLGGYPTCINGRFSDIKPGPVKIKFKRKKKKKPVDGVPAASSEKPCDRTLSMQLNYSYANLLSKFKSENSSKYVLNGVCEQASNPEPRKYFHEERAWESAKDVYEFKEDDDVAVLPPPPKVFALSNKNENETPKNVDFPPEPYSRKLKLTLKVKKDYLLDFGIDGKMRVLEPQYEVLRLQAD